MCHPATYVNKVVVGGAKGDLQLWNIRTKWVLRASAFPDVNACFPPPSSTLIHVFDAVSPAPVTVLAQSPAVDILGVGYQDGSLRIVDIRAGEDLFQLKMAEGGIAGMSFRMGEHRPLSTLLAASRAIADRTVHLRHRGPADSCLLRDGRDDCDLGSAGARQGAAHATGRARGERHWSAMGAWAAAAGHFGRR